MFDNPLFEVRFSCCMDNRCSHAYRTMIDAVIGREINNGITFSKKGNEMRVLVASNDKLVRVFSTQDTQLCNIVNLKFESE